MKITDEKVKLATFTKPGRGRNQCKRRRAKQVVHRNRNALGLTEKQKRELGRERRERERRDDADEEIQDKDAKPSGGADTEAPDATTTPPLFDQPSLQVGKDGGGRRSGDGQKIDCQTQEKESVDDAPDPDKRCGCVRVRYPTPCPPFHAYYCDAYSFFRKHRRARCSTKPMSFFDARGKGEKAVSMVSC